jgi:hypothetical protein
MNKYDPTIWFQVSSRHRIVARFPKGKTGKQALAESGGQRCDDQAWIDGMGEGGSGDFYLRVYANTEGLWKELTIAEWRAFKKAGGTTYQSYSYQGQA